MISTSAARAMGTATAKFWFTPFKVGRSDYILGSHPLWQFARCVYQTTRPPIVLAGALRLAGFSWAVLTGVEKQVPADFIHFRRQEQMARLRKFLMRA